MDQPYGESEGQDQDSSQSESSEAYKVVIDGEEKEVPLDELIGGYQRQADYTQKTQDLSSQKQQYEQLVEQKATELYLKALEEQEGSSGSKESDPSASPEDQVQQKLAELQSKLENTERTLEDKAADEQLDKLLSSMREKYPNMDEEKVLIRFHNEASEVDDPSQVFEKLASESDGSYKELQKKIIDEYIQKKSVSPFDAGETGGSTSPTQKTQKPVASFEEARERAEARLRAMRGE